MQLSHEILVESSAARTNALSSFSEERILEIFDKAKAIIFVQWNGVAYTITASVADYLEVPEPTVKSVIDNNSEEFKGEIRLVKGEDLQKLRSILNLPPTTAQVNLWTPRAMLRVAMLLTKSEIAKKVRDIILDLVSAIPDLPVMETVHHSDESEMTWLDFSEQKLQAMLALTSGVKQGFKQTEQIIKGSAQDTRLSIAAEAITVVSEVRHAAQDISGEVVLAQEMISELKAELKSELGSQILELKQALPSNLTLISKVKQPNRRFHSSVTVQLSEEEYALVSSIAQEKGLSRARLVYQMMQQHLL